MSAIVALVASVAATGVAAVCAAADGALLGGDPEEPPSSAGARHRALVLGRLLASLLAGTGVGAAAAGVGFSFAVTAVIALVAALVIAGIVDGAARGLGEAAAHRVRAPLPSSARLVERIAMTLAAPAERLEEAIAARLPEPIATPPAVVGPPRYTPRGGVAAVGAGLFALGELEVRDVMVPRVDIVGVERETPWSEVVDRFRSSGHARLPVFEETVDEVVGILYAKDLLPSVVAGEAPSDGWTPLVRPAVFIPATKRLDHQLRDFRTSGTHLAIVVDEYGGTAGIVTIEDVLEEIVGEIRDETDDDTPTVEVEDGRRFWVPALLTLDELSELTEHEFEVEGVTTVGGLVYQTLGRVPRAGESFTVGPFRVIVEQMNRRRVRRVYFERVEILAGRSGS